MIFRSARHFSQVCLVLAASLWASGLLAQEFNNSNEAPALELPDLKGFAAPDPAPAAPLAATPASDTVLAAQLIEDGSDITRGLVWRVFRPDAGPDGKLPLVASAQGGTTRFALQPGSYLVHASFGRAGATKRITVGAEGHREILVLDAGGLELDATMENGKKIPADDLKFSIYEAEPDEKGDRALIIPDVKPRTVVRLNSGVYHVVSTYGNVNAVIRSDIRVDAGKLTEATVEHRAARLTMKLVREAGGEAIADTSWSILTGSGDPIRESVGAYASMVLAEGEYTVVAKNRDRIYQKTFTVVPGEDEDVEVLATEVDAVPENEITD